MRLCGIFLRAGDAAERSKRFLLNDNIEVRRVTYFVLGVVYTITLLSFRFVKSLSLNLGRLHSTFFLAFVALFTALSSFAFLH